MDEELCRMLTFAFYSSVVVSTQSNDLLKCLNIHNYTYVMFVFINASTNACQIIIPIKQCAP